MPAADLDAGRLVAQRERDADLVALAEEVSGCRA